MLSTLGSGSLVNDGRSLSLAETSGGAFPSTSLRERPSLTSEPLPKNEVAIHLLEEWLADESGYNETVWDAVKSTIEENRFSERRRFDD